MSGFEAWEDINDGLHVWTLEARLAQEGSLRPRLPIGGFLQLGYSNEEKPVGSISRYQIRILAP